MDKRGGHSLRGSEALGAAGQREAGAVRSRGRETAGEEGKRKRSGWSGSRQSRTARSWVVCAVIPLFALFVIGAPIKGG